MHTVLPSGYTAIIFGIRSANQSSPTGHCSNASDNTLSFDAGTRVSCPAPASSVLFDGNIPTLSGLDGNMWASQLLTMKAAQLFTIVNLDFSGVADYDGVGKIEVVMFNCPQWGIAADSITVHAISDVTHTEGSMITTANITVMSCESLVKVCIPCSRCDSPIVGLEFHTPYSNWVHLAEVVLYNGTTTTCPPDTVITPPPDPIITSPTECQPETTTPPLDIEGKLITNAETKQMMNSPTQVHPNSMQT